MAFAEQNFDFPYWQKQKKPLFADLAWNIPEQKTGRVNVIGGNSGGFHGAMRFAEFLARDFPVKNVDLLVPDALRDKIPPLANLDFAPSTESGSFASSTRLNQAFMATDLVVLAGDLSRNSATAAALAKAIQQATPGVAGVARAKLPGSDDTAENSSTDSSAALFVMCDAVDLLAPEAATLLQFPRLILFASMMQLQKIFRAVYYPRMLMLSQPLTMAIETLHKFTLSYPVTILTFHDQQLIVAKDGNISTTPLEKSGYSMIELWGGRLAAKVAAYNLYNPAKPFEATTAAIFAS